MNLVTFAMPGNEKLATMLTKLVDAECGQFELRQFPDGETHVRIGTHLADRNVILICSLDRPTEKAIPLYLVAKTVRDLGARSVGLVAPYLAYMRQDYRFHEGDGVTSNYFAELVSSFVDWLVTVDPHLHRRAALGEIYTIPARVVHAAPVIAEWIRQQVPDPVVIGPDGESAQWAEAIAEDVGAPSLVLGKKRRGDREVEITIPDVEPFLGRTPVLVDDIISTARTMSVSASRLCAAGLRPPICVGIHAVFAGDALAHLLASGATEIVTCDTIAHASNTMSVAPLLAESVADLLHSWDDPKGA